MSDANEAASARPTNFMHKIYRGWQWTLGTLVGLIIIVAALATVRMMGAPGAPVTYVWIAFAIWASATIANLPPVYFRLPKIARMASYAGLVLGFGMWGFAVGEVQKAYDRTPAGKIELAQRQKEEAAAELADRDRRDTEQRFAEAEALGDQLREIERQQQACLSWGGEVGGLSDVVRDGLHDPSSFEHVETHFIAPEEDRLNVVMRFRAKNGFGAVRTAEVRAQMDPASCEILQVSDAEPL